MGGVKRPFACLSLALLCAAVTATAAADWLVTREGARVETRGGWEVKGRQVVFTLPNGTLSSLRLDDVDLEASAAATAAALEPPPEPPAPEPEEKRPPVLVLTNADVRPAAPPRPAAVGEDEGAGAAETGAAAAAEPGGDGSDGKDVEIEILTWKAQPSDTVAGLEIVGTLRNVGTDPAVRVEVGVTIPDEDGGTLFETTAFLRTPGLPPGRHTNFRALLPNIYQLPGDPVFDVKAMHLATEVAAPAPAEDP